MFLFLSFHSFLASHSSLLTTGNRFWNYFSAGKRVTVVDPVPTRWEKHERAKRKNTQNSLKQKIETLMVVAVGVDPPTIGMFENFNNLRRCRIFCRVCRSTEIGGKLQGQQQQQLGPGHLLLLLLLPLPSSSSSLLGLTGWLGAIIGIQDHPELYSKPRGWWKLTHYYRESAWIDFDRHSYFLPNKEGQGSCSQEGKGHFRHLW